jgi:1-deoxy-D-xylulose-5-phosphate reductoisomerase
MSKSIAVLGSTGSIGTQTLDVARRNGFRVETLAAHSNIKLLEEQIREFKPKTVAVLNEQAGKELKTAVADTNTKVIFGSESVTSAAASTGADTVLNAIVGIAGLKPTLAAIENGKEIALANKETLVTGGSLVKRKLKEKNVKLLPVDSEHSAIFQCLQGAPEGALKRIILTASGGPFFGKTREELKQVTPAMALKHPNWNMGAKITIDSATLMNKGLEVIEAVHLFDVNPDKITVAVHRQSIIHSAVEFNDGAVIAQLGAPDMRLPIQYAITYPERVECPGDDLDIFSMGNLTFQKPDLDTFSCLSTCIKAIGEGGLKPAAANGANEEAVRLFLDGKIGFLDIAEIVALAADSEKRTGVYTLEEIFDADKAAREKALAFVK